jgi:hypothetical protein
MARAGYGDLEVGAETSSVQAVHPVGSASAPGIAFSTDTDVGLYRVDANQLGISVGGTGQISLIDGVLQPITTNDVDLGTASLQFKNAWFDGTLEADAITVGGVSVATGTNAATVTVIDSTDTSAYVALFDSATGSLAAKTDAGVTYNAGTGMLTATGLTGPLTGVASTATALASARNIGGVSFDGTGNINLPGVNTAGNQATSGLAATATLAATTTALASARNIGGVSFDGTGNIDLPGVNAAGNQATSGLAATATLAAASTAATVTVNDATAENNLIPFVADAATSTGNHGLEMDTDFHYNPNTGVLTVGSITGGVTGSATQITVTAVTDNDTVYPVFATGTSGANAPEVASALTYNPSTGLLTSTGFSGPLTGNVTGNASGTSGSTTGNAATATALASARNIGGVSFDGTGNIDLPGVNASGNQNTSGTAAGLSATLVVGSGGTGITSLGSGVATFMGTPSSANLRGALTDETGTGGAVFATSPTLVTPALGTPASGNLTNCTNAGKTVGFIIAMA